MSKSSSKQKSATTTKPPFTPKKSIAPRAHPVILSNENGTNNTQESNNNQQLISDLLPPTIRPLSFKERKEIFNKNKQTLDQPNSSLPPLPQSTSTITTTSTSSNANVNKRLKIETQNDKENQEQTNINITIESSFSKDEADSVSLNTKKQQQNLLINSRKNHSNQNDELKATTPLSHTLPSTTSPHSIIDQNNNENINKDEELIDQMLMMSANNILNSAQELQVQKAKLKSKSSVKMKTFYGGEVINDVNSLNLAMSASSAVPLAINPIYTANTSKSNEKPSSNVTLSATYMSVSSSGGENFNFEFIGAGVKLEKSNLISNNNQNVNSSNLTNEKANGRFSRKKKLDSNGAHLRVNFTDVAETYEYPSYEFLLKELGIDPDTDPDYQMTSNQPGSNSTSSMFSTSSDTSSSSTVSFSNFLPGRIDYDQNDGDERNDKNKHDDSGDADVEDSSDYISITPTNTSNSNKNNANLDIANATHFSKLSEYSFKLGYCQNFMLILNLQYRF